ncbi:MULTISPECIES: efflux transporter outer membrane subunit [Pseudomonas]|uniref:efflux transporter outer membrane subunit n=1 Tax=Pseudomonas TaxID=286 RepID=UPI0009EC24D1|nr:MULTISPECIES: efflux transporter outer membrane subunit [Pseudomonas]MBP2084449.1 NodT family efflux transporter outer membrane factor (OMF) lipoprotein [Pseudomonas sp. PvP089]MBP2089850.1 NodT family efflux transporter outer membrane factor (OMF) lipoprotein [Pseudomonas sp. PvP088]MBP2223987.1 NodT family efflux transporter outer membrane factor (OMF) lipoprotein [Pseudomonas putida]MDO1496204.1 efflux transporter outer membrane subunit [Pseudomonas putida]
MPLLPSFPSPARFAVLAILGVLAACTRQPAPAEPPAALLANPLANVPAGVSRQPLPQQWWALFQDPQLNHWVQQALAHNQDLAQAEANVQAMLAGIGEFDARRWPSTSMDFAATYGKSADDQTLAEATDSHAPSQWQFNPGIELAYQVDVWGQVRAAIERARAQAEASAAALDLVRLQVVAQTSRAYLDQCIYTARLDEAKQSLQTLDHSVQLSERQRQAGVATALDSERLLGLREQVRAQLPMLAAGRQMALYELGMLSGQASLADTTTCTTIPTLSAPLPAGDGWHLLERRPDVRQAERELQAATLETDIVRADLYPKVSFGASLTSSDHHLANLGDSRAVMFGIGPLIRWEFPNMKANRARVGKAEALQQAQVAHYHGMALSALKDVRQALARYDGERQRLQALDAALAHSQRGYALAQGNYRAGTLDGLALLDSERELIRLRASHVEARGRLAQAQVNLFRALGGRW